MGFVDLVPLAQLTIENAYFKPGSQGVLADYTGTQDAHFQVETRRGLRLLSVESHVPQVPADQVPASDLVAVSMRHFRFHRYYYAIVFAKTGRGSTGSAVLLGANTQGEIDKLGARLLSEPDTVCGQGLRNCVVFPKNCTVSVQMAVTLNGTSRVLGWGARLGNVAPADKKIRVTRTIQGRNVVTEYASGDLKMRGLELVPGDRIFWE